MSEHTIINITFYFAKMTSNNNFHEEDDDDIDSARALGRTTYATSE